MEITSWIRRYCSMEQDIVYWALQPFAGRSESLLELLVPREHSPFESTPEQDWGVSKVIAPVQHCFNQDAFTAHCCFSPSNYFLTTRCSLRHPQSRSRSWIPAESRVRWAAFCQGMKSIHWRMPLIREQSINWLSDTRISFHSHYVHKPFAHSEVFNWHEPYSLKRTRTIQRQQHAKSE